MRIYLAASSREVERVRRAQRMIADRGWELTRDWLTPIEERLARGLTDADLTPDEASRYAYADIVAIDRADVLWLLAPVEPTRGAWWEHGYAVGRGIPTVVSGPCSMLFVSLADRRVDTDEDALDAIASFTGGRRLR